jgi:hypothetical protein
LVDFGCRRETLPDETDRVEQFYLRTQKPERNDQFVGIEHQFILLVAAWRKPLSMAAAAHLSV